MSLGYTVQMQNLIDTSFFAFFMQVITLGKDFTEYCYFRKPLKWVLLTYTQSFCTCVTSSISGADGDNNNSDYYCIICRATEPDESIWCTCGLYYITD